MADPIFTLASIRQPFGIGDVGYYASPTFADIDGDDDMDIFVGEYEGNTVFHLNRGDANRPDFAEPDINPFGLSEINEPWGGYASPSLVDIDGDGDMDAFVGSGGYYNEGEKYFFRNTGTATNPDFSSPMTNPFGLGYDGYRASPTFSDIDGDGDQDAFVGESDGNILFFRNTGTVSNPVFSSATINPFGLTDVGSSATPTFIDIDSDGDQDAFVGESDGNILFFRNIGTVSNPLFSSPMTNPFGLTQVGTETSPTFIDIDGDGDQDAFVGKRDGDTTFFVNNGLLLKSTSQGDTLNGTPSLNDIATYASATAGVNVSLLITTQQNTIGAGLDTLTNIENLIGSNYGDKLTGDSLNNVLDGEAGNDTLTGWSGADTMNGGTGNDTYFVENVGDKVIEKLNEGIDTVSSKITHTIASNVENLTLTGTALINGIGNSQNNSITGNSAANELNGGAGNDTLDGGLGTNKLTGGTNNDIFKFTTKGHIDAITDYNVANDTIQLENAVFTALATTGTLAASQFRVGTQAADANDFIIYNKTAGTLLYDSDGSGAAAATQIASLSAGLGLTNADIVVV